MRYPQITVKRNDANCTYDVTYKHQQYGASIKVSRELLEDNMATTDFSDSLAYSYGQLQQQVLQQQAAHTHGIFGGTAGSTGGWVTNTSTGTINGTSIDSVWFDEAVERVMDKKKQTPKRETKGHWPNRWYRVNEDMSPKEYGLAIYEPEPLDDLRKEIGEWLYENQN